MKLYKQKAALYRIKKRVLRDPSNDNKILAPDFIVEKHIGTNKDDISEKTKRGAYEWDNWLVCIRCDTFDAAEEFINNRLWNDQLEVVSEETL